MLSQPIFLRIDSSFSVFYQIFLGLSLVFICWFIFTDAKEGNFFRSVCHSVHGGMGVGQTHLPVPGGKPPPPASRHPQKEHGTRQEVASYTFLEITWNQTGSDIIYPLALTSSGSHCSSRYTSYRNAFLASF